MFLQGNYLSLGSPKQLCHIYGNYAFQTIQGIWLRWKNEYLL